MQSKTSGIAAACCTPNSGQVCARDFSRHTQLHIPKLVLCVGLAMGFSVSLPSIVSADQATVSADQATVSASEATARVDQLQVLGLRQAIENSIVQNKQLAAFGYQLSEHDGRVQQAGLFPNPQLGLLVENLAGQGDFDGTKSSKGRWIDNVFVERLWRSFKYECLT